MHPQNTCQPSHITPLIRVYRGSLSVPDLSLLEIFRLFEQQRKYSVASLMASWGPDPGVVSTDILNTIIGLNSNLLFATCVEFPQWRTTQKSCTAEAHRSKSSLYDPFFILLLLHSYLSTQGGGRTLTPLDWVGFFRTNIASLVISSLSARQGDIRGLGWTAFGGLCNAVAQAEFYEKAQTFYIFKMLSRLHKATPANELPTENPRLSTYTTLFFAHAIRAVYTPASSLYPLVSRFLLQRPEFDLNDPPMLYSMLYSSLSSDFGKRGGNWKRERVWMLRFLADGMVSSQDWKVLQRRHTWDLLATTYHTHSNDGAIKQGVLKVLLRMTQNQRVVTSLVCHSHLLSWASFTISGMSRIEDENTVTSWCQALENIVVFVDHERVTKRMGNLWHAQLLLCVNKLLNYITGNATTFPMDQSLEGLCTLTRIIQRFSSLPDTPATEELILLETKIRYLPLLIAVMSINTLQANEGKLDAAATVDLIRPFNSLSDLLHHPSVLSSESSLLTSELTSLCHSSHSTFLLLHNTASTLSTSFDSLSSSLDSLLSTIPSLNDATQQFSKTIKPILEERRRATLVLDQYEKLADLLEIPALLDSCSRNGQYQDALELVNHANSVWMQFEGSEKDAEAMSILRSLQREVEGGVRLMLGSLVEILKGRSKLPVLYKAIVFLRQLGGWDEEELAVLFLCCRGAFIENLHSANETAQIGSAGTSESQRDMARYLRGYIDIFREGVYDLVSAYTTIFLDHAQNTEGASRGTQDELIFLLSVFTSNQISSLMRTLSLHLSSVHDFTSLSSLLTQLNYCGSSFARIGLEFRPLLTKHFEQAVLMNIKQSMEHAATEFVSTFTEEERLGALPSTWLLTSAAPGTSIS
ncbi:hypothetical protein FS842_002985, partial [Serendipita sp. 407]